MDESQNDKDLTKETDSVPELSSDLSLPGSESAPQDMEADLGDTSAVIIKEEQMIIDDDDKSDSDSKSSSVLKETDLVPKRELTPPPKSTKCGEGLLKTGELNSLPSSSGTSSEMETDGKATSPVSGSVRGGSPEKKVINLSPVTFPNMFKNPVKSGGFTASGIMNGGGASGKTEINDGNTVVVSGTSSNQMRSESKTNPAEFMKLSQALATALKSEPKKKVFCANTNCNMKTDNAVDAPAFARLYFGMTKSANVSKICTNCFKKAESFHKKSKSLVQNKENLFDLTFEIQTASSDAVVDLDSPGNSPNESDTENDNENDTEMYSVSVDRINDLIKKTMDKFDIKQQLDRCTSTVVNEVDELASQFSNLDMQLDQLRDKIDLTTKLYNENIAAQSMIVEIGSVHVDSRGGVRVERADNLSTIQGLTRQGMKQLTKAVDDLDKIAATSMAPHSVPPPQNSGPRRLSKLIFVKPKENQDVYAQVKHSLFYWLPAKILTILHDLGGSTYYKVQFQAKVVGTKNRSVEDQSDRCTKTLTGKQIAFKKPSNVTLPVGTRIIARFKDLLQTDKDVDGMYYAGIVAEIPKPLNKSRYLIFFDDGYAQYVFPYEVLPVVDSSQDVWEDVHQDAQEFIRQYVSKFPDRHMIRAQIGTTFSIEFKGNWIPGRLMEVDGSLMRVRYLKKTDITEEWIYRGSTRLSPLFNRIRTLETKQAPTSARRHTYRSNKFSFEVNTDNAEDSDTSQNKDAKRFTGADGITRIASNQGQVIRKNGMVISTVLESEGSMRKMQIPKDRPSPKKYTPHECSPSCAHRYEPEEYRKVSPLAIPFYLGWARELSGQVYYHTPCGVRCGTYEEVHDYIVKTKIEIPIDFFSMEAGIDCLNEFEPKRKIEFLKDISYGKEWTPISCVNSLDHELPQYMEYISERICGKDVNINSEPGFLTCCDCEDDCLDKSKCACWKLTMSGISFKIAEKEGEKLLGYENRRLKEHVLSGIYECNINCKCKSTCFNRVVQNKVKWPIQMFKTVAKGWGVRALHDMPKGTFICVYTGQLLTDACANETGLEVGDEYLAELDFIECNEQMKEDYESDVTDIETEEPGTKSKAREERRNSNDKQEPLPKKPILQKAVKSTGGKRRQDEDDSKSTVSSVSTVSAHSVAPSVRVGPVARKSGSRNGTSSSKAKDLGNKGPGGNSPPQSGGVPSPAPTEVIDCDDDDEVIQVYSSFLVSDKAKEKKNIQRLKLREYFGKEETVYIMDAKTMGNFGRYLNHSCKPNVFVQNLFVDTHDPRFPWVAFFTKTDVKAGTELTWDYNYEIGSVQGKTLYCYCLQPGCRGRLL